jgi:hypothetical protein
MLIIARAASTPNSAPMSGYRRGARGQGIVFLKSGLSSINAIVSSSIRIGRKNTVGALNLSREAVQFGVLCGTGLVSSVNDREISTVRMHVPAGVCG